LLPNFKSQWYKQYKKIENQAVNDPVIFENIVDEIVKSAEEMNISTAIDSENTSTSSGSYLDCGHIRPPTIQPHHIILCNKYHP
jgi:hypothetical protein